MPNTRTLYINFDVQTFNSQIKLQSILLSVDLPSVILLPVILLIVILLSPILLNVVSPFKVYYCIGLVFFWQY
jgi:hypothetical protein